MSEKQKYDKALDHISAGLRILRNIEERGTTAEQRENEEARQKLHGMLQPVVEAAERALEEVRPLRKQWGAMLSELVSMRGRVRVRLSDDAWHYIEAADATVNRGIEGYERLLDEARAMLAWTRVSKDELVRADRLAKEMRPVADLAYGVKYALGHAERALTGLAQHAPDLLAQIKAEAKPAPEPTAPTEAERRADSETRAWRQIWDRPGIAEPKPRLTKVDTAFNPYTGR